jgi:23S rRNA pseudouridine2605 synthase
MIKKSSNNNNSIHKRSDKKEISSNSRPIRKIKVIKKNQSASSNENRQEHLNEGRFNSSNKPIKRQSQRNYDRPTKNKVTVNENSPELVRLNKIIASSGICSRREADDLIKAGLITVNGKTITELGTKVNPDDDIRYNGERLRKERLVYILLNKPKDYITTTDDPHAKRTVMELIEGACKERVYPVGRLDRNTTGVLLLTNDGELAKKLTHPSFNHKKIYHAVLDKNLKSTDLQKIKEGVKIDEEIIEVDDISYASPNDRKEIGIALHSGQNHIVRKIFEALDYKVIKLDRVYFCGLSKKGLPRGKWRFLSKEEISMLKRGAF